MAYERLNKQPRQPWKASDVEHIEDAIEALDVAKEYSKALFDNIEYEIEALDVALDAKVDKEYGKVLSSNDYTTEEKNKLAGLSVDGFVKEDYVADNYLSLSGGELTGELIMKNDRITLPNNKSIRAYASNGTSFATLASINSSDNVLLGANSYETTIRGSQVTIPNTLYLSKTEDASGTADKSPALIIGDKTGTHLEFDGNEIMAKTSGTAVGSLFVNTDGGLTKFGGDITSKGVLTVEGTGTSTFGGDVYINGGDILFTGDGTARNSIGCYWADDEWHFIVSKDTDGLTSYFGWAGSV